MSIDQRECIVKESIVLESVSLARSVTVDFYLPVGVKKPEETSLLLINDGQDLDQMGFKDLLGDLYGRGRIAPLLCAGIHAGAARKMEYGVAARADYAGRGGAAARYRDFIFRELLPHIRDRYKLFHYKEKAFAGFSLGALSAMDMVWSNPGEFTKAGLFSGAFWWRLRDQKDRLYNDDTDRIMQREVREGSYHPGMQFFFECGGEDETEDRNGNGIIDSIDDTRDLIGELVKKGYEEGRDIRYLEIAGGRHDPATWARAMPLFLEWGWKK